MIYTYLCEECGTPVIPEDWTKVHVNISAIHLTFTISMSTANGTSWKTNIKESHRCKVLHVKELNFGQNKIDELQKEEFIRQWLLSHNKNVSNKQVHEIPLSSTVESPIYTSDQLLKSPVFNNRHKRFKTTLARRKVSKRNIFENNDVVAITCLHGSRNNLSCKQDGEDENFNSDSIHLSNASSSTQIDFVETSPIVKKSSYRTRKRKLHQSFQNKEETFNAITNETNDEDCVPATPPSSRQVVNKSSRIIKRTSYQLRKRKLHQSFISDEKSLNTTADETYYENHDEKVVNKTSPVIVVKQHSSRKLQKTKACDDDPLNRTLSESCCQPQHKSVINVLKNVGISQKQTSKNSLLTDNAKNLQDVRGDVQQSREMTVVNKLEFLPISQQIDTATTDVNEDGEIFEDRHIEDNDSDKTASDLIEDIFSQENNERAVYCRLLTPAEISTVSSEDSDKTFFSEVERNVNTFKDSENDTSILVKYHATTINEGTECLNRNQSTECLNLQTSEKISQASTYSNDLLRTALNESSLIINSTSSQSEEIKKAVVFSNVAKRRKKSRKGSLCDRLQTIINREISFVRMWRHQIQNSSKESYSQFVNLCIHQHYLQYDRQVFECRVIDDSYELLNNLKKRIDSDISKNNGNIITIMTVPEIVGHINIADNNCMKLYPPWEIINNEKCVISALYFIVYSNEHQGNNIYSQHEVEKKVTIKEYDCPCFNANKIVKNCSVKFRNVKPNVIEEILDFM